MLRADPRKHRQLSARSPDIFWRGGQTGRTGLVVSAMACGNPECPCRDVDLTAFRVGEWLAGVTLKKRSLAFFRGALVPGQEGPPEHVAPVLRAELDIDTGVLRMAENAAADMRDESALAWLRDEMDGALLDHLAEKMLRSKGLRPLTRVQVKDFDHGAMVYFAEAFLAGRVDSYMVDGGRFELLDAYCVEPGCACTEMRLLVDEEQQAVGTISLDLLEPHWIPRYQGKPELRRIWPAFARRYPDPRPFRKRAKLMREAGPEIMASARPAPRVAAPAVGRNQPCPCGSGKKYKRCCLSKISPDV